MTEKIDRYDVVWTGGQPVEARLRPNPEGEYVLEKYTPPIVFTPDHGSLPMFKDEPIAVWNPEFPDQLTIYGTHFHVDLLKQWSQSGPEPGPWFRITSRDGGGLFIDERAWSGDKSPDMQAVETAVQYGGIDGAHHKTWVIDQMVRMIAGDDYDRIVAEAKAGEDGPDTYEWDVGIAP